MIYVNDFTEAFRVALYSVCEGSPFGAGIISYFEAYSGKKYDFLEFWVQADSTNTPTTVYCKYYSTLNICGKTPDIMESDEFIRLTAPTVMFCSGEFCTFLQGRIHTYGEVMRCTDLQSCAVNALQPRVEVLEGTMGELREVFNLIKPEASACPMPLFEEFFLDSSHKLRHGTAKLYAVKNVDGRIISTASIIALSERAAVLGNVATLPAERNKGLASAVAEFAVHNELSYNRTVYLYRERPVAIYDRMGFKTVGSWDMYLY